MVLDTLEGQLNITVLEERPEQILILNAGNIEVYPNTQYWNLKLKSFGGNRIMYKFNDDSEIIETYDNQIFNCKLKGELLQLRHLAAEGLSLAIEQHKEKGDMSLYEKIWNNSYLLTHRDEMIKGFFTAYPGVKEITDGYLVNDVFKVDKHGVSHFKDVNGTWHSLCTVMKSRTEDQTLNLEQGELVLNATEQTILAKVFFLLNPNLKDRVFMDQLPQYIKDELHRAANEKTKVLVS